MDLEALLREAVRTENLRRKDKTPERSSYSEDLWVFHRTVGLVHIDSMGKETPLGVFKEYLYKGLLSARRLVRSEGEPSNCIQLVHGAGWLEKVEHLEVHDTPEETEAIRRYLARRSAAEVKAELIKLSADAMLDELLDE